MSMYVMYVGGAVGLLEMLRIQWRDGILNGELGFTWYNTRKVPKSMEMASLGCFVLFRLKRCQKVEKGLIWAVWARSGGSGRGTPN